MLAVDEAHCWHLFSWRSIGLLDAVPLVLWFVLILLLLLSISSIKPVILFGGSD